jgi:hypothetical protein
MTLIIVINSFDGLTHQFCPAAIVYGMRFRKTMPHSFFLEEYLALAEELAG